MLYCPFLDWTCPDSLREVRRECCGHSLQYEAHSYFSWKTAQTCLIFCPSLLPFISFPYLNGSPMVSFDYRPLRIQQFSQVLWKDANRPCISWRLIGFCCHFWVYCDFSPRDTWYLCNLLSGTLCQIRLEAGINNKNIYSTFLLFFPQC